jgi:proton-dependent oligopeptide transporter, POT family
VSAVTQEAASPPPGERRGVTSIIAFEATERFAFYAMLTALGVLMTANMSPAAADDESRAYITALGLAVYVLAFVGAILAEAAVGKFKMVATGAIIACGGYGTLVFVASQSAAGSQQWPVLLTGVGLVAVGTGVLKPCIAAHLGDQFDARSEHLLPRAFAWFYFFIHAGPLAGSVLAQSVMADARGGVPWALALPLIALAVGTLLLWRGGAQSIRTPRFGGAFTQELFGPEGGAALRRLLGLYVFVALFWIVWQRGAAEAWPRQAAQMDLRLLNLELGPEQISAANIVFILLFIPLLSYVIYPLVGRVIAVTAARKIGAGLFLTSISFAVAAAVQQTIDSGGRPPIAWQLLAWALLTLGEVMVIVTAFELSYRWAPRKAKSLVMCLWLLTPGIREVAASDSGFGTSALPASDLIYYTVVAAVMFAATICFAVLMKFYRDVTYLQQHDEPLHESESVAPPPAGGAPT